MLDVKGLGVAYAGQPVLRDVSFSLGENQWLMLVGPNGAGKSTLVGAISQSVRYTGSVFLDGQDAARLKPAALARKVGVLSQNLFAAYAFTVGEVVRLGRYAYAHGIFATGDDTDEQSVQNALEMTGMLPFKDRSVLTLSGGELQRTFLAQVFAQDPELLILDEPTSHLDLVYQRQMFALIDRWVAQPGRSVLSVVHDLSLARAHGTEIMLLDQGRIVSKGPPAEAFSRENLQEVYGMDVHSWMLEMLKQWEA
ncbi:MAG: ABC transporter ATP-binding protein [Oscillospiraceae bacterium]